MRQLWLSSMAISEPTFCQSAHHDILSSRHMCGLLSPKISPHPKAHRTLQPRWSLVMEQMRWVRPMPMTIRLAWARFFRTSTLFQKNGCGVYLVSRRSLSYSLDSKTRSCFFGSKSSKAKVKHEDKKGNLEIQFCESFAHQQRIEWCVNVHIHEKDSLHSIKKNRKKVTTFLRFFLIEWSESFSCMWI